MINLILLLVGAFMDTTPAVSIFTPIFLPVASQAGRSPLHFGIMMRTESGDWFGARPAGRERAFR
ncbi:TRAP transporter large permease subunit [Alishewanella longhuensis]